MSIVAMKDRLCELRESSLVLDLVANMASQCTDKNSTSIMQVGMFLTLVHEKQMDLMESLEIALGQLERQASQETVSQNNSVKEV